MYAASSALPVGALEFLHCFGHRWAQAARCLPSLVLMCRLSHTDINMATNLALDPALLDRVVAVSGEQTKKAAVTLALKEFVARREQKRVAELFGKLEWDESFDYKAERSRP